MNCLKEFSQYKAQMERQLKMVAVCRQASRPKRAKTQMESRIAEFESNMLGLKRKWTQMIENLFRHINDTRILDKMINDLTNSLLNIHNGYSFEGDQIDFALRCTIIPISGSLMDEFEVGRKAFVRQERRTYFLESLLYGTGLDCSQQSTRKLHDHSSQKLNDQPQLSSPSNARNPTPISSDHISNSSNQNESQSQSGNTSNSNVRQLSQLSIITISVLNVLFEAVEKHCQSIPEEDMFKIRISHVINISYIVDVLSRFLDDVINYLERNQASVMSEGVLNSLVITTLKDPMSGYEELLEHCLKKFEECTMLSYFRRQLDLLLFRVKLIRSKFEE